MLSITDYMRRVTTAGTATINGASERFTLGRIIDSRRYDLATLTAAGITTESFPPMPAPG